MKDKIFFLACFGFVGGILLRSFVWLNFYTVIWVGAMASIFIFFFSVVSKRRWAVLFFVFILFISVGVVRFHFSDLRASKSAEFLAPQVGERVELTGMIVDDPNLTEKTIKFPVRLTDNKDIKILVSASFGEDFQYGDKVKLSGKLEKPENFITDTGKEFDYINYLRKDGIYYLVSFAEVEVLSGGNGNVVRSFLFSLKNKFLEKIDYAIAPPESLLMGGLILGEKSAFPDELRESFVRTGTIHIVALSGYNITIVAEGFMKLFKALPRNLGLGMGMLAIILFVIMTGGQSTALRAGVMAILVLVARATGRNYDVGRALILAGVGMVLFNPFILAFDVSFQLSFIATVAVIFLTPRIEKYFMWMTTKLQLRDIFSVTTSAYIFVLPFILYKMGNLSLVALPANILVLPFIPWTMGLGFATGIVGLIWAPLALPFGFISQWMLHYELAVINYLSNFSFASYTIPNFPLWLTIIIYAYFTYFLFGKSLKKLFSFE